MDAAVRKRLQTATSGASENIDRKQPSEVN